MLRSRPAVGGSRHARASVVALACLVVTAALHASAGGSVPVPGLLMAGAVAYALGSSLVHRRRALPVAVAAIAGCQALMHVVLSFAGAHAGHGGFVPSAPMLAAHLLAAVATACVLCRADDLVHRWLAFWRTLSSAVPRLPVIGTTVAPVVPTRAAASGISFHVDVVRRRGPPCS